MAPPRPPSLSLSPPATRFPYRDANGYLAVSGDLLVLAAHHESTLDGCTAFRSELAKMKAERTESVAIVLLIEASASMPDPEVRKQIGDTLAEHSKSIGAYAVINETTGFHGAATRAIVTSILLASRPSFPHGVFSDVEAAAAWLAERRYADPSRANAIAAAIREVRRADRTTPG